MSVIDFSLLDYCADDDCPIVGVHARHRRIRAIKIDRTRGEAVIGVDFAAGVGRTVDTSTLAEDDIDLTHEAVVLVDNGADVVVTEPDDDGLDRITDRRVSLVLLRNVYDAVRSNVPRASMDIYHDVIHSYGSVDRRWVIESLRVLVTERRVASLANPWLSKSLQRSPQQSGWYVRYDSPKLWRPDGFRDLQRVVAEQDMERSA